MATNQTPIGPHVGIITARLLAACVPSKCRDSEILLTFVSTSPYRHHLDMTGKPIHGVLVIAERYHEGYFS